MSVRLSSLSTVFTKFVFAPVWILGFGYGTLMLWIRPEEVVFNGVKGAATPLYQILFLVGFLAGTGFLLWYTLRLKRVILEHRVLRISNYFQEIEVPVKQVVEVRQSRNVRPPVLTLILRQETDFGTEIVFMPSGDVPSNFLEEHDIAKGFREFADPQRGTPPRGS